VSTCRNDTIGKRQYALLCHFGAYCVFSRFPCVPTRTHAGETWRRGVNCSLTIYFVKRSVAHCRNVSAAFPQTSIQFSHPLFTTRSHSAHSSSSAHHTSESTFTMGKSDANQTKKRSHKAKATDGGEIKHKNKPSFDAMIFKATDNEEGPRHSKWQDLFRQLCEYKVQFGDCLVPRRYSTNPKLGNWVNYQRNRYKDNTEAKSTSTTAEHIRALNGIGFEWDTSALFWNERVGQLREFTAQFGHCIVPIKYSANPKLGRWVSTQRQNYKLYQEGKPSRMTEERIRELESVGFKWEASAFIPP
jgi:hypothetical protein